MTAQKKWTLKGNFYECCRMEGHCPIWFGRDLWDEPCVNFVTYEIEEGQIQDIDMKGITIIYHQDNIGPKFADLSIPKREGAVYISDNATDEQRKILETFSTTHMRADNWKKCLGVKFVKIDISKGNGRYHITMPFGEQHITLSIGGDGKNPVRLENPALTFVTDVKVGNGDFWKYSDYGKDLEFHNTSSVIAYFTFEGN